MIKLKKFRCYLRVFIKKKQVFFSFFFCDISEEYKTSTVPTQYTNYAPFDDLNLNIFFFFYFNIKTDCYFYNQIEHLSYISDLIMACKNGYLFFSLIGLTNFNSFFKSSVKYRFFHHFCTGFNLAKTLFFFFFLFLEGLHECQEVGLQKRLIQEVKNILWIAENKAKHLYQKNNTRKHNINNI